MTDLRIGKFIPKRHLVITRFYPNMDKIPDNTADDPSNTSITEKEWIDENIFGKSQADEYYKSEEELIDDIVDDKDDDKKDDNKSDKDNLGTNPDKPIDDKDKDNSSDNIDDESDDSNKDEDDNKSDDKVRIIHEESTKPNDNPDKSDNTSEVNSKSEDNQDNKTDNTDFTPKEDTELSMIDIDSLFK